MADIVIRKVTEQITTFSKPFTRGGVLPIGGRTTAVKLQSGDVFVYASTPLSAETKAAIAALGEVKYIVTPDFEHAMYITEFAAEYPNAKAIGVEGHEQSKPGVKWAGLFGKGGEAQQYGFEPEISLHWVPSHQNKEIVAIHHPSKTLIEGDMLFNLPPTEQYSKSKLPFLFKLTGSGSSMSPGGAVHALMIKGVVKDKASIIKELAPIHAADFTRIIPCHGDVIEREGKVAWDKVWGAYK